MSMDRDQSYVYYNKGREAYESGDRRAALEKFGQSIKLFPHFKTLELLGECLLREDRFKEAIVYLGAAVGLGNNPFRAHFLLAQAWLAVGEKHDAIVHLKKAIEMNPDYKAAKELLNESLDGSS